MWMLCFVALAVLSGRRPASSLVLAWALALVLLVDPWAVTAAGFWLSFCAVAAILFAIASRGRQASVGFAEEFAAPQPDEGPRRTNLTMKAALNHAGTSATGLATRSGESAFARWLGSDLRHGASAAGSHPVRACSTQ